MTEKIYDNFLAEKWQPMEGKGDLEKKRQESEYISSIYNDLNSDLDKAFHNGSGHLVPEALFAEHYKKKSTKWLSERKELMTNKRNLDHLGSGADRDGIVRKPHQPVDSGPLGVGGRRNAEIDVQQGTAKLSSNKSTISLPLVMGAYDTNLKDGRRVKRIHVIVQTPSSWDPAFAKSLNYFELAGGGKELVIDFSSENPIFCADELLVNDIFLDENGQHIYKNLTAEGEKHEALLKFEEEIEKDKDVPSKMVIALPFECSELCTIALGNEAKGILKIPKVSKSKNVFVLLFAPSIFHSNSHVFLSLSLVS